MKCAYLIIAHNEFSILKALVSSLDIVGNDLYIHIDKKVRDIPDIESSQCNIFFVKKRNNVFWGDYSQIECELNVFDFAKKNGPYDFYHLISGTHLPLQRNECITSFFEDKIGKCLFCHAIKVSRSPQEVLKVHRINICTSGYASNCRIVSYASQFVWKSFIALQRILGISINDKVQFYWANNWCSLSQAGVEYLLSIRAQIRKRYRWSFCGDEWFAVTELMNSHLRETVVRCDELLYCKMNRANATSLSLVDYDSIISSGCLFARKFTQQNYDLVEGILQHNE